MGDKGYQPWVLEEEALPILKKVYDRGLNTWDTCCSCSNGVSKEILSCRLALPARDQSTARVIQWSEPLTAHDAAIIDQAEEVARKKSCTTSQVALAWVN